MLSAPSGVGALALRATAALAVLLGLALPPCAAATREDATSLLAAVRDRLERGEVDGATAKLEALRGLLRKDRGWDPDGSIAERLLPELESRIAALRAAIAALEALPGRVRAEHPAPRAAADEEDLTALFGWGFALAGWTKSEIERIVTRLPAGPDRGVLLQSRAYAQASRLLQMDILPRLSDTVDHWLARAGSGDERVRALKTRLDALKAEIIASSMDRAHLQADLDAERDNRGAYDRRLIEFIGGDPAAKPSPPPAGLSALGTALADRLRERLDEVRALARQTSVQKAMYLEEVDRFRMANAVSVASGSRDLAARIETLVSAIEAVPAVEADGTAAQTGWFACCLSQCRR